MSAVVQDSPVAVVERYTVALPDGLVERALLEVLDRGERDGGFAAGLLLGRPPLPPALVQLDMLLRATLVKDPKLTLAYIKAGDGDAPPECRYSPCAPSGDSDDVFRVLVNLSEYGRHVFVDDEDLLIPGRRCGAVHALHFWPSAASCCGVNDKLGYFLAAYEATY